MFRRAASSLILAGLLAAALPPAASAARRTVVLRSAPVAEVAAARGLPILKPAKPRDPAFLSDLRDLAPDCCPVVAYGARLPPPALAIPPQGWVNLHFSVLPAWRGAAPVQRSLMAGDEVTGATTFRIVEALDAGPTYGLFTETIRPDDTAGTLLARLAEHGAGLLVTTLDGIEDGTLEERPQPTEGVSLAPKLTAAECEVDWTRPAFALDRHIRGCTPDPGAWTTAAGTRLGLGPVRVERAQADLGPGELEITKRSVLVGTATEAVLLGDVRPPGKSWMPAADWARGLRDRPPPLGS